VGKSRRFKPLPLLRSILSLSFHNHTYFALTRSPTTNTSSSSNKILSTIAYQLQQPSHHHHSLTAAPQTQYDAFLLQTHHDDRYARGFSFPCREAGTYRSGEIPRDACGTITDPLAGSLRLAGIPSAGVRTGASLSSHLPQFARAAVSAGDGLEQFQRYGGGYWLGCVADSDTDLETPEAGTEDTPFHAGGTAA